MYIRERVYTVQPGTPNVYDAINILGLLVRFKVPMEELRNNFLSQNITIAWFYFLARYVLSPGTKEKSLWVNALISNPVQMPIIEISGITATVLA